LLSKYNTKQSPPIPVDIGSVTLRAAATATAASIAFPPFFKIDKPISDAKALLEATRPFLL
jgi:hypothetical protein